MVPSEGSAVLRPRETLSRHARALPCLFDVGRKEPVLEGCLRWFQRGPAVQSIEAAECRVSTSDLGLASEPCLTPCEGHL